MLPLDIISIEQRARRLRAAELQNVPGVMSMRMRVYGRLVAATLLTGLLAASDLLRLLFSWNPQPFIDHHPVGRH